MAQSTDNQDLADKFRAIISNAYAAVQGEASVQTFSAITFEELAAQQIQRISGVPGNGRPNVLAQIQKVATDLSSSIAQMKAMTPDAFAIPEDTQDVNTPP